MSNLVDLVEGCNMGKLPEHMELQMELLASATHAIRDAVLELLRCARDLWDNPYDDTTMAAFSGARALVSQSVEHTEKALKLLLFVLHKKPFQQEGASSSRLMAEAFAADVACLIDVLMALHQIEEDEAADELEGDDDENSVLRFGESPTTI